MLLRICTISLSCLVLPLSADSEEISPWELTGAAGLMVSDGNNDSVAYSLQFLASYLADGNEAYLGADYFYAEDRGRRSTDSLKIFSQYNRDLSERWYVGARGSYFRDQVADIDYRVDAGVLLGYRAIAGERATLSFEAGPGYAWEKKLGNSDSFATLRLAQRFEYQFSEVTKFWQSLAWLPSIEDFSDSVVEFEAGLETRVTDKVSLRSFVRHRTDTNPSPGRGRSDTAFLLGVAYDLGGLGDPEEGGDARRSLMPDEEASAESKDGWVTTAALGFSLNQGNADRLGYHMAWNTAYRSPGHDFFFDLGYTYSEDNGLTSNDRLTSRLQFNRKFDGPWYVGFALTGLRDAPARIDYRIVPSVLAGYSLIDTEDTSLVFELGPSYTFEKLGGVSSDFVSLVAAQRFEHAFSKRFSLKQSVVFNAELADFDNSSLVGALAFDTRLSDRLIWRLGLEFNYENQPAAGRQRHDTLLTGSVATKF